MAGRYMSIASGPTQAMRPRIRAVFRGGDVILLGSRGWGRAAARPTVRLF
jgi:hypothetical protein